MKILAIDPDNYIFNKYSDDFFKLKLNVVFISKYSELDTGSFDLIISDEIIPETNKIIPIIILTNTEQNGNYLFLKKDSSTKEIIKSIQILYDSIDWAMNSYETKKTIENKFNLSINNIDSFINLALQINNKIQKEKLFYICLEICFEMGTQILLIVPDKNNFKFQLRHPKKQNLSITKYTSLKYTEDQENITITI